MKASDYLRLVDVDEKVIEEIVEDNDRELSPSTLCLLIDAQFANFDYVPFFKKLYLSASPVEMQFLFNSVFLFPAYEREMFSLLMMWSEDKGILRAFHSICQHVAPHFKNYLTVGSENAILVIREPKKVALCEALLADMKSGKLDVATGRDTMLQVMKTTLCNGVDWLSEEKAIDAASSFRTNACSFNIRGLKYFEAKQYRLAAERFSQAILLQKQIEPSRLDDKRELSAYYYNEGNTYLIGEHLNAATQAFANALDTMGEFVEKGAFTPTDIQRVKSYYKRLEDIVTLQETKPPVNVPLSRSQRKHKKYNDKKRAAKLLTQDPVLTLASEITHEVLSLKKVPREKIHELFLSRYPYKLFWTSTQGVRVFPTIPSTDVLVTPQAQVIMRTLEQKGARSCLMDASLVSFAKSSDAWHLHILTDVSPSEIFSFQKYTVLKNQSIAANEKIKAVLRVEAFHEDNNSPYVMDLVCCEKEDYESFQNALCALHSSALGELTDNVQGCIQLNEGMLIWNENIEQRLKDQPLMLLQLLHYMIYEAFFCPPALEKAIQRCAPYLRDADQGLGIFILNTYWGLGKGHAYYRALKQFDLWPAILAWDQFALLQTENNALVQLPTLLDQNDQVYKTTGIPWQRLANLPAAVLERLGQCPVTSMLDPLDFFSQQLESSNAWLMVGLQQPLGCDVNMLILAFYQFQRIVDDLIGLALQDASSRTLLASVYCNQACCLYLLGLWTDALSLFQQAEGLTNRLDNPQSQARLIHLLSWRNRTHLEKWIPENAAIVSSLNVDSLSAKEPEVIPAVLIRPTA